MLAKRIIGFSIGDDYIELSNSEIIEKPEVTLLPNISGQARTLTTVSRFDIPEVKIAGKISIRNTSGSHEYYNYELKVKNTRLKTAVNYFIEGDGFTVENYLNEFEHTDMKLTYENESGEIVSVLDKLTDKVKREAVEHYLLDNTFDEILSAIHDLFLEPLYDRGSASNQVGADYSLRNKFRIHLKQLYGAFKIFVDKFLDATNESLKADSGSATLPKLFCIGETDDGDEVLSVVEARIENLNTMRCDRRPIVLPENKEAHLYIPLEFENLMVTYKKGDRNVEICVKTIESSFMQLAIKKINDEKADIKLVQFKIKNLEYEWNPTAKLVLDPSITQAIEDKIKSHIAKVIAKDELGLFAVNPPNVEIDYDSDDFSGREEGEEENADENNE
uniref:Phage tail protein n=1 Tax=Trichogramma kaykai TaxID=54128 RepID=A0ABD2WXX9_9HYME